MSATSYGRTRVPALVVAAPMSEPLGPIDHRPASAAVMRRLADVAERVERERTFDGPRRISWETRADDPDGSALSLVVENSWTSSATTLSVRLHADPRGRSRGRAVPDDGTPPALTLLTRIPIGEDLRDHVDERTLPVLAALARAAAEALDGTRAPLGSDEWEDAVDAIANDAWHRFADARGHAAIPVRMNHVPASPFARQTDHVNGTDGRLDVSMPPLPAAMEIHVGGHRVRMERLHRAVITQDASDPMSVLRANALFAAAAGGEPPRDPSTTDDGRKPQW